MFPNLIDSTQLVDNIPPGVFMTWCCSELLVRCDQSLITREIGHTHNKWGLNCRVTSRDFPLCTASHTWHQLLVHSAVQWVLSWFIYSGPIIVLKEGNSSRLKTDWLISGLGPFIMVTNQIIFSFSCSYFLHFIWRPERLKRSYLTTG